MTEKLFKSGEVIFEEGVIEFCMYELISGKVGIYADYGKESERLLTELSDQAVFGEMAMIDARPRSATAVALDDVKANQIVSEEFGDYFAANPDKIYGMMTQMARRIRELSHDYQDVCRAAAELTDAAKSGKEKSSWFGTQIKKFSKVLSGKN